MIQRKNVTGQLTNITDDIFELFLKLQQEVRLLHNKQMVSKHKELTLMNARAEILTNTTLHEMWKNAITLPEPVPTHDHKYKQKWRELAPKVADDLFKSVMKTHLKVLEGEFLKKLEIDLGKKKEVAHRAKVLIENVNTEEEETGQKRKENEPSVIPLEKRRTSTRQTRMPQTMREDFLIFETSESEPEDIKCHKCKRTIEVALKSVSEQLFKCTSCSHNYHARCLGIRTKKRIDEERLQLHWRCPECRPSEARQHENEIMCNKCKQNINVKLKTMAGELFECTTCHLNYHAKCVRMRTKKQIEQQRKIEQWKCPNCGGGGGDNC